MRSLDRVAESLNCCESVDTNEFQRKARILQAIWRQDRGYPIGGLSGKPRGAMMAMPWARESMANFITPEAKQAARDALGGTIRQKGSLIRDDRMYAYLLSSQPMAFNLFAPLQQDLKLASAVMHRMLPGRCSRVTAIAFEYSPGRGDSRYTADFSAFDVFVQFQTPRGTPGFVGVEVKYHENLKEQPDRHRARYDEVARDMGCFRPEAWQRLRQRPLQQIWRDHLLAGACRMIDGFDDGLLAFLSPSGNPACNDALSAYQDCLTATDTFVHWSLEAFVDALLAATADRWVREFSDRYLAFDKVESLLV